MGWTVETLRERAEEGRFGPAVELSLAELGTICVAFPEVDRLEEAHAVALTEFAVSWSRAETRDAIRAALWEHCRRCIEEADYGATPVPGEDHLSATLRHLGVAGEATLLRHLDHLLPLVHIDYYGDPLNHRFVLIEASPPWEKEHGVQLVFRNGAFVALADEEVFLSEFDKTE